MTPRLPPVLVSAQSGCHTILRKIWDCEQSRTCLTTWLSLHFAKITNHNRSQTRPGSADPGKKCDHFPIERWQQRPKTTCKTPGIIIPLQILSVTFNLHNTICCYTNCQNTPVCFALNVENWSGSASMQLVQETSRVLKGCLLRKNFKWAWQQQLIEINS